MKIELLLTGNELMNGDVIDSNSSMIAQRLQQLGIDIHRKVTVGDHLDQLVEEMERLSRSADLLLVNGGLGPTRDDLTAEALARTLGVELVEHPDAMAHLTDWCARRGATLNAANLKQALLPAGVQVVPNPRGSAVGFRTRHNDCDIICTPGVPSELREMLNQTILPEIAGRVDDDQANLLSRFHCFGQGESSLQQWISNKLPDWPEELELGFRAGAPTLEVKVQGPARLADLHGEYVAKLRELIGDYVVAEDRDSLAGNLIALLKSQGKTLTCAESCTGGLIASMLTAEAGASAVFEAGFVTYSNAIKQQLLGVSAQALTEFGAVSDAVVRQMAEGALRVSGADYTIAVSGIAGPDGGSAEKPVGTVWLAWGDSERIDSACLYYPYARKLFQTMVAGAGLDLIRRRAAGISSEPRYLQERRPPATR
ncbi:CinA family nicotinamide mononucleotide deamidase-related protein [Marinobacterium arenosum]|uniref:CinA family nicotinamide mononucleotide deamidase-related protein n=1 Tax=Marinobacterium arenosum TaxID=2862496 RepID=UPI001C93E115|nr:CinA family nicotinamide mononucleotide deamidase-related protein [Marinobacterium arenosum]MBY4675108.1 CinA family nicotinamide mononucleotide deamidase-related protein [Marinobacterium arenosum]